MSEWSAERLCDALKTDNEKLRGRFAVLRHAAAVVQQMQTQSSNRTGDLLAAIVQNLGFVAEHPLALEIRTAAHSACLSIGERIVDTLLRMHRDALWQYCANVVTAAIHIATENDDVRNLAIQTAKHEHPQVREKLAIALRNTKTNWASEVLKVLEND